MICINSTGHFLVYHLYNHDIYVSIWSTNCFMVSETMQLTTVGLYCFIAQQTMTPEMCSVLTSYVKNKGQQ